MAGSHGQACIENLKTILIPDIVIGGSYKSRPFAYARHCDQQRTRGVAGLVKNPQVVGGSTYLGRGRRPWSTRPNVPKPFRQQSMPSGLPRL